MEILPDAPRFTDHASSVICNEKLYLLGSRVTSGSEGKVFDLIVAEVDVYDFKTRTWSMLDKPVSTQRAGCTAICIKDKILFTGGESKAQKTCSQTSGMLEYQNG